MFEIPIRHFARYYEIISVLIRYGLGYLFISGKSFSTQPENLTDLGSRLRKAFTELGPTFVKIGQIASTRSDLLPKPIVQELAKLQVQVKPLPFAVVRQVIETSLQVRLESVYQEFDPIPLGSASIGQVHQAVLNNGDRVAVKVQRPFIKETVKTDLEIFGILVKRVELGQQQELRYPLRTMLEEFSKTISSELDFLNEGRNAEKLARLLKRKSDIVIPKIYWEYSHPSVITMEYLSGITLFQFMNSSEKSKDAGKIADHLCHVILLQILREGFFHADPHPGNIVILSEGKIGFIDFGIIGQLSPKMRNQTLSLVSGIIRGNFKLVFKTLSRMGVVPDSVDKGRLKNDIVLLRKKHWSSFKNKNSLGESIQEFFDIIYRHRIYIPSEFILIGKTLLTLEGTLLELDPAFNLINHAKPFSKGLLWKIFWNHLQYKFP